MTLYHSQPKKSNSPAPRHPPPPMIDGKIIIAMEGGRVRVYPITNSDRETAELLSALHSSLVCGDLAAELIAGIEEGPTLK